MPVDISDSLKNGYNTVFGLKFFNNIFSSTVWTSVLITAIVLILLIVVIPVDENTPVSVLFKFMFYTFLGVVSVLFLHGGVLRVKNDEIDSNRLSPDLAKRMEGGIVNVGGDDVEVKPVITSDLGDAENLFQHYGC